MNYRCLLQDIIESAAIIYINACIGNGKSFSEALKFMYHSFQYVRENCVLKSFLVPENVLAII